jgi:hypothetical protein
MDCLGGKAAREDGNMIPFSKIPKPNDFQQRVEQRGAKWLAKYPTASRPTDYWSEFKNELADGFRNLCGYSCMYTPVGTVDHFISWKEDRNKAYDWSNYRFSAGWLNSSKQDLLSIQVLDPFEVQHGWFEIILPSLQLILTTRIPEKYRKNAQFMLERLHLRDDERVMRQRREWYQMYLTNELTLDGLRKKAPQIAAAVEKQAREPLVHLLQKRAHLLATASQNDETHEKPVL